MEAINTLYSVLKKAKWNIQHNAISSLCPFHTDTTPSFGVSFCKNAFNCFSCSKSGNLDELCEFLNIPKILINPYRTKNHKNKKVWIENKVIERDLYSLPPNYFYKKLKKYQEAKLNPNDHKDIFIYDHPYLDFRGINEDIKNKYLVRYDLIHEAIFVPIFDLQGNIVANYRRFKKPKGDNKCLYTQGFKLSESIYGMNFYSGQKALILTEGINDAFTTLSNLKIEGLDNSFFCCSVYSVNNFNEYHIKMIKDFNIDYVIMLYDNDPPGQEGLLKVKDLTRNIRRLKFLQVDYNIWPKDAKDPDELFPNELKMLLETVKKI